MSTTQENRHKGPCDSKDACLFFNVFISSANAKSFQFTLSSCFWTRIRAGSSRLKWDWGAVGWIEPSMLRALTKQCSWSLASDLNLPLLPHQTLREEQMSVSLRGRIWVHCSTVSVCSRQYLYSQQLCLVSTPCAQEVKQYNKSWLISLHLKSQVPLWD